MDAIMCSQDVFYQLGGSDNNAAPWQSAANPDWRLSSPATGAARDKYSRDSQPSCREMLWQATSTVGMGICHSCALAAGGREPKGALVTFWVIVPPKQEHKWRGGVIGNELQWCSHTAQAHPITDPSLQTLCL